MNDKLNIWFKRFWDLALAIGVLIELSVPFGLKKAVDYTMSVLGDTTEYSEIRHNFIVAVVSIMS